MPGKVKNYFTISAIIFGLFLGGIILLADTRPPVIKFTESIPFFDKIGHFFLMGIFAFIVNMALSCKTFSVGDYNILTGSTVVLALVLLEEFSQIFITYRSFSYFDILFDILGIAAFSYLSIVTYKKLKQAGKPLDVEKIDCAND